MASLQEIQDQEQQLKQKLSQLEAEKENAKEQEKQQKLALITTYENEANGYRNQAEKANNDADKKRLYGFANDADNLANELRIELGLQPVQAEEPEPDDQKNRTLRKINSLVIKAVFALVGYFITDFTAGQLQAGFISYALESVAHILYFVSGVMGGSWLVCITLYSFVPTYVVNELADDFKSLRPFHRLVILTALGAALLHFLNACVHVN